MANGRVLPSALLFDWLLGRAWNMAMVSYANAERFGSAKIQPRPVSTGVSVGGEPDIEGFLTRYAGDEASSLVRAHDQSLSAQMAEVARAWANEMEGMIASAAPVGPSFLLAVGWLRKVVNGGDGLGYLGYDHRNTQLTGAAGAAAANVNLRGLPTPAGAMPALRALSRAEGGFHAGRAAAQMTADHAAEAHKLRVDAAEALIKARNEALDATMEHAFTQLHLMFDVFGRNNDYLRNLQREEAAIKARFDARTAELAGWSERIMAADDSYQAANQELKAVIDRQNTVDSMLADAHIKLLRRYSSRAASALNSAGVSVTSTASESNNVWA